MQRLRSALRYLFVIEKGQPNALQMSLMATSTVYFVYLWISVGTHPFRQALNPRKYLVEKTKEEVLEERLKRELGETTLKEWRRLGFIGDEDEGAKKPFATTSSEGPGGL
ncbi:hypothetical protein Esti_004486 [Eimeria stiedai]